MAPIVIRPAVEIEFDTLVRVFNAGYSGYPVPVHIEAPQLRHHLDQNAIDLEASRIALADEAVVGVGLLGIRGERGWIGGLGVIPIFRQQGVGRAIMRATLEEASARGLKQVQLEVIDGNTAAHNLYLDLGFSDVRRLLILECSITPNDEIDNQPELKHLNLAEALDYFHAFHSIPNPWQRDYPSLTRLDPTYAGWAIASNEEPLAYAIGRATDKAIQLADVAFAPGHPEALTNLIEQIHQQHPATTAHLVNLGADDPAWPLLEMLGYRETLGQHEMCLIL